MGFFDSFKKKNNDFGFSGSDAGLGEPPVDSHSSIDANPIGSETKDIFTSPSHSSARFNPQPDSSISMPLGDNLNQRPQPTPFPQNNQNPLKHDFELISSKLDYLKASIEAVNQRLANIEHLVRQEQDNKKW